MQKLFSIRNLAAIELWCISDENQLVNTWHQMKRNQSLIKVQVTVSAYKILSKVCQYNFFDYTQFDITLVKQEKLARNISNPSRTKLPKQKGPQQISTY